MDPEFKISKLKRINYDELIDATETYKKKSDESEKRMHILLSRTKESKKKSETMEHKKIWMLEAFKLNNQKRKLQREIDSFIMSSNYDFRELKNQITEDHIDFRSAVIDPVFLLCDDIKEWNLKRRKGLKVPNPEPIVNIVMEMKENLNEVLNKLYAEEIILYDSLDNAISSYYSSVNLQNIHERVGTGIPQESFELCTGNDETLSDLLSHFIFLDENFQSKLDKMIANCNFVNKRLLPQPWTKEDQELFDFIYEYYVSNETVNRNQMLSSIRKIVFYRYTPAQIEEMDQYTRSNRLLKDSLQALLSDWRRDRAELSTKLKLIVDQFNEENQKLKVNEELQKNQKEICQKLNNQVTEWQQKKRELQELEEEVERQKEEEARLEADAKMEREMSNRKKTKQKVIRYKMEKSIRQQEMMEERERRMEELREYLASQAEVDRERVRYRAELWSEKMREQELEKMERMELEEQNKERLNQLVESVRPVIESDPERLLQPTAAWLKRTEVPMEDIDFLSIAPSTFTSGGSHSLYQRHNLPLHTYTDKTIMSDPRVRVEAALRQAGLVNKDYARTVLNSLQPAAASRKDCNLSELNFLKQQ